MIPKFVRPGAKLYHPKFGEGTVVEVGTHQVIFVVGTQKYTLEGIAIEDLREPIEKTEKTKETKEEVQSEPEEDEPKRPIARTKYPGRPKKRTT